MDWITVWWQLTKFTEKFDFGKITLVFASEAALVCKSRVRSIEI